jgi:hypothetical protein
MSTKTLLVSKIDNIEIMQDGDSILTSENKSHESTKVVYDKSADTKKERGTTKTVDLGKGSEKHNVKFYVLDKNQNDAILKIIRDVRTCVVTDKYKGKLTVYIDRYKITDSDKHFGKTVFEIECTVQDIEPPIKVNYEAKVAEEYDWVISEIPAKVKKISELVTTVDEIVDVATDTMSFVDSILNTIQDGMNFIVGLQSDILGAYAGVMSRVNKVKRLAETIKNITKFPQDFIDLLIGATEDVKKGNAPIYEARVRGKRLSEVNIADLSQIEYKEVMKQKEACELNNLVALGQELKKSTRKDFGSQDNFQEHIEIAKKRLEYIGYEYSEIIEKQQMLKGYANQQKYRDMKEIQITRARPLVDIVFNLYGNLDNYDEIEKMNNFKDNDNVYGLIKVYDANSN